MTNSDQWAQLNAEIVACTACPRLVQWRQKIAQEKRRAFQDWDYWGQPVPGFGDQQARLVIIGLAPAAHGANRTGRMFTGNGSGDTLTAALHRAGFANQPTSRHRDDGLQLRDAFLTALARCAPPGNRPTPDELDNCQGFLVRELALLSSTLVRELALLSSTHVVLTLGQIAFDRYRRLLGKQGADLPRLAFRHGASYRLEPPLPALVASYHPSRQNTQTGRLTGEMLDEVFAQVRRLLDKG